MIHDAIDRDFLDQSKLGEATPKQVQFAAKFQRDLSQVSRRIADAVVGDLMTELNLAAIQRERLATGVTVKNKHDVVQREACYLLHPARRDSLFQRWQWSPSVGP